MIQKGFDGVDEKFATVNERIDDVNLELKGINKRLTHIEDVVVGDHEKRIEKLETKTEELEHLIAVK